LVKEKFLHNKHKKSMEVYKSKDLKERQSNKRRLLAHLLWESRGKRRKVEKRKKGFELGNCE